MVIGTQAHFAGRQGRDRQRDLRNPSRSEERRQEVRVQGHERLLCIERDLVSFGTPVRTKDFVIVPIYDDCGGSACGRSRDYAADREGHGDEGRPQAEAILCRVSGQVRGSRPARTRIAIALDRQQGQQFSATFRDGKITIAGKPLDPKEPLSDDDCTYLYEDVLDACIGHQGACRDAVADLPGANARPVRAMETNYAAFPGRKVEAACEAACASKEKAAAR